VCTACSLTGLSDILHLNWPIGSSCLYKVDYFVFCFHSFRRANHQLFLAAASACETCGSIFGRRGHGDTNVLHGKYYLALVPDRTICRERGARHAGVQMRKSCSGGRGRGAVEPSSVLLCRPSPIVLAFYSLVHLALPALAVFLGHLIAGESFG
jgi:hypothetical protein